ncbi:MAG: NYN domain-containing protein [Verrucomicrobiota bacterium]
MNESRYLLIDAYNVIFATSALRTYLSTSLEAARDQLAELVRVIHDAEAVRIAVVLDSRSDQLEVEHPYGVKTFEYLYAPAELSADGVIERILRRASEPGSMTVVSNDNLVREATRASGALAIRPEELFEWSAACEKRLQQDALRRNQANAKEFQNGLDLDLPFGGD